MIRTQEVRPPSARAEAWGVLQAIAVIVLLALLVVALQKPRASAGSGGMVATQRLAQEEVAFGALPAADQRMFRQVREGIAEAERIRAESKQWANVAELAAQEIPPFAHDPLDRAGYQWTFLRRGPVVNYVGAPTGDPSRPWFLVLIVEPDPGMPVDPRAMPDEIHHKLPDGTLLHVSIWIGPPLVLADTPVALAPVDKGWHRVTIAN